MNGTRADSTSYRGRFAPSPTGPLHFGSLVAAVASYLDARAHQGEWLVRIEDIDPTREQPGAGEQIIKSLAAHGFEFAPPLHQSTRLTAYDALIEQLLASGTAYPCSCSRKEIRASAPPGLAGPAYPGTCRSGADTSKRPAVSVRLRVDQPELEFNDQLQGLQSCSPVKDIGDFLLRRGDGLVAYQMAVVADDEYQGITHVVRGTDLLEPTFMQLALQQSLGYATPAYLHFPVAVDADGTKLSKQTGALPLDDSNPSDNLIRALAFLRQNIHNLDKQLKPKDILDIASGNWAFGQLQGVRTLPIGV